MVITVASLVRFVARIPVPSPMGGKIKPGMLKRALIPMLFMKESSSNRTMTTAPPIKPAKEEELSHSSKRISPNMKLLQCKERSPNRQVVLLLSWLLAKEKHLQKYDAFYARQGFDVLCVRTSPFQLMFPVKGTQMVAQDVLNFLESATQYEQILVHGFSVGAYLYGEILAKIEDNQAKYNMIKNRVVGQIFDSAVDVDGIPSGFPKAVLKNVVLQKLMEAYMNAHMKVLWESAGRHYYRSSLQFHNNFVEVPSLFLFSKDDPVGTAEGNLRVIRKWEPRMPVYAKCWESSPHVSHLYHHPDEYLEELSVFLEGIGLLMEPHRRASKI